MPLHLYTDVYASGAVPGGWVPTRGGTVKYPVRNPAVHRYLRQLLPADGKRSSNRAPVAKSIILNMRLVK